MDTLRSLYAAAGLILGEGSFDAPVVRQVQAAPVGVRERRLLGAGSIALEKLPAEVESVADPDGWFRSLGNQLAGGVERRNQGRRSHRPADQAAAGHRIV